MRRLFSLLSLIPVLAFAGACNEHTVHLTAKDSDVSSYATLVHMEFTKKFAQGFPGGQLENTRPRGHTVRILFDGTMQRFDDYVSRDSLSGNIEHRLVAERRLQPQEVRELRALLQGSLEGYPERVPLPDKNSQLKLFAEQYHIGYRSSHLEEFYTVADITGFSHGEYPEGWLDFRSAVFETLANL